MCQPLERSLGSGEMCIFLAKRRPLPVSVCQVDLNIRGLGLAPERQGVLTSCPGAFSLRMSTWGDVKLSAMGRFALQDSGLQCAGGTSDIMSAGLSSSEQGQLH